MASIITNAGDVDVSHIEQGMHTRIGGVKAQVFAWMPEGLVLRTDGEGIQVLPLFIVKELVARDVLFFHPPVEDGLQAGADASFAAHEVLR